MPFLVLVFIVLPIAELYVIIQVGQAIGVALTLTLLLLDGIVGAVLARSQGRAAWRRFNLALAEGRVPARETADGAMIIFGGALLLTPGFITDVFGLLLLLPPTRALIRRGLGGMARRRTSFTWTVAGPGGSGGGRPGGWPPSDGRGYDYEGTAREVGDPGQELPPGAAGRPRAAPPADPESGSND
jgi:UPF0716 protein FxsA